MLVSIITCAVVFVVLAVIAYRLRKNTAPSDNLDEEEAAVEPQDTAEETKTETKETEIFGQPELSATLATGLAMDGDTLVGNVVLEDKIGKDTVLVELKKAPVKKATRARKAEPKKAVAAGKPTAEDLAKTLKDKIAKRTDLLKIAKIPASEDKTLNKLRHDLDKVMSSIKAGKSDGKKAEKKVATVKVGKVKVTATPEIADKVAKSGKTAGKTTKKAPAKKTSKKTAKKSTKKPGK